MTTPNLRPCLIPQSRLRAALAGLLLAALAPFAAPAETVSTTVEVRGLEVLASSEGFQDALQVQALAAAIEKAGFNQISPEVRTMIGVAYPSSMEPQLPMVARSGETPLGALRGRVSSMVDIMPIMHMMPAHTTLMGEHPPAKSALGVAPGMACLNAEGQREANGSVIYLDPGNPMTREYLLALVLEMIKELNPTGVILADFEYPGRDWGYSDAAVAAFRAAVGGSGPPEPKDPVWCAWRREQLTQTLRYVVLGVKKNSPNFKFAVMIEETAMPPTTWDEWLSSRTYAEHMQDWLNWCRIGGLIDEIIISIPVRQDAETGKLLDGWARFLNNNSSHVVPVISLSGEKNHSDAVSTQFRMVRSRGIATSLNHYAMPTRDRNVGFYESMPKHVFGLSPGKRLDPEPLIGDFEARTFALMSSPPPTYARKVQMTPTPTPEPPLKFESPTPSPSPTPDPVIVPADVVRTITLTNGRVMEGRVLEVRRNTFVIQPTRGSTIELPRRDVAKIEPPI